MIPTIMTPLLVWLSTSKMTFLKYYFIADIYIYKAHTSKFCGLCFEISIVAFETCTSTCGPYTSFMLVTF